MNFWDGSSLAVAVIAHEETSPNCAGSPSGPATAATTPVFSARNSGPPRTRPAGQGVVAEPGESSSRNVDQIAIADWPAK